MGKLLLTNINVDRVPANNANDCVSTSGLPKQLALKVTAVISKDNRSVWPNAIQLPDRKLVNC
jgi:hypothetical protein